MIKLRAVLAEVHEALAAWKDQDLEWKEKSCVVAKCLHNLNIMLGGCMLSHDDICENVKLCIRRCNSRELLVEELRKLGGLKAVFPLTAESVVQELGLSADSKVLSSMVQLHAMRASDSASAHRRGRHGRHAPAAHSELRSTRQAYESHPLARRARSVASRGRP